jgi:uncharacterized membrane-anchored protein YitT (DUF2179 family)
MAENNKPTIFSRLINIVFIIAGAFIAAYGLESVLIPNNVSDGGITGISIMLSTLTPFSLGIFLILLNIPFIYLGYKLIGKTFAIYSTIGIGSLSFFTSIMHHTPTIVHDDSLLVTITGGLLLGIGMGLALRNGGALDGTDMLAVLISRKVPFSTGEIILTINLFIFIFVGFVFGIEGALSSAIAYYIATRVIGIIENGLQDAKSVAIISPHSKEIGDAIIHRLGRSITYSTGRGGFANEPVDIIYCVINRMEESKLRTVVKEIDPNAFMTITDLAEVRGGNFNKRNVH